MSASAPASARTLYQYTLQDTNQDELNAWAPKILAKMQQLPQLADVTSDQENSGTTETLTYDRDQAVPLRHPARDDRQHPL